MEKQSKSKKVTMDEYYKLFNEYEIPDKAFFEKEIWKRQIQVTSLFNKTMHCEPFSVIISGNYRLQFRCVHSYYTDTDSATTIEKLINLTIPSDFDDGVTVIHIDDLQTYSEYLREQGMDEDHIQKLLGAKMRRMVMTKDRSIFIGTCDDYVYPWMHVELPFAFNDTCTLREITDYLRHEMRVDLYQKIISHYFIPEYIILSSKEWLQKLYPGYDVNELLSIVVEFAHNTDMKPIMTGTNGIFNVEVALVTQNFPICNGMTLGTVMDMIRSSLILQDSSFMIRKWKPEVTLCALEV